MTKTGGRFLVLLETVPSFRARNGTQAVPYGFTGGWILSSARVVFEAGGRLPPLRSRWGVVPFNHTGSSHYVSGTAHRPFPTVSLVGGFFRPHRLYLQRGGRLVAAPTGVIPFIRPGYIRNVPGTAHRPFPTVSLVGGFFHPHRLSLQRIGRHTGSILWGAFYTVEHLSGFV